MKSESTILLLLWIIHVNASMREKCPKTSFSGPYFPVFSPNTENKDQKDSVLGHFSRSACYYFLMKIAPAIPVSKLYR